MSVQSGYDLRLQCDACEPAWKQRTFEICVESKREALFQARHAGWRFSLRTGRAICQPCWKAGSR